MPYQTQSMQLHLPINKIGSTQNTVFRLRFSFLALPKKRCSAKSVRPGKEKTAKMLIHSNRDTV